MSTFDAHGNLHGPHGRFAEQQRGEAAANVTLEDQAQPVSDPARWRVGTVLVDESGRQRVITRITPAGAAGTRMSDGPTFHARIMRDGVEVPGGHTADIRLGSMSYPTSGYAEVPSNVTGFDETEWPDERTYTFMGHWDGNELVVEATAKGEFLDHRDDDGHWPEGLWADTGTGRSEAQIAATLMGRYEQCHGIRTAYDEDDYTP